MENLQINIDRIKKFPFRRFKKDFIYKKGRFIYKLSPESMEVMEAFESFRGTKIEKQLALAESFLYQGDMYAGYMMKYYRFLFKIQKCINEGRIRDAYAFFSELLEITAILRGKNILYWDFHSGNIKVTRKGRPFFLDLGDAILNPTNSDEHRQREFYQHLY